MAKTKRKKITNKQATKQRKACQDHQKVRLGKPGHFGYASESTSEPLNSPLELLIYYIVFPVLAPIRGSTQKVHTDTTHIHTQYIIIMVSPYFEGA